MRMTLEERFWSKVRRTETCWLWAGATFDKRRGGYGCFLIDATRRTRRLGQSHRVAWELASGRRIPGGLIVGHTCDTPLCVRNDDPGTYEVGGRSLQRFGHLFLGTFADNHIDMHAKGRNRAASGEAAGPSLLTAAQVSEIRKQFASGRLQREIAAAFAITQSNVSYIVNNHTWRD